METEIEKEKEFTEINPRKHEPVDPYIIQKGAKTLGMRVSYDALSGVNPKQAIIDSILVSSVNGTQLNTTSVVDDILANQIFGA